MIIIIILINGLLLLYFFIKNKDSIYFSLKTRQVNNVNINLGMSSKKILTLSFFTVVVLHGLYNFLVVLFPILGQIFVVISYITFIVILILLRNTPLKDDSVNLFLKYNKNINKEELIQFIDENNIRFYYNNL